MDNVLGLNEFKVVNMREDKHNVLFVVSQFIIFLHIKLMGIFRRI